MGRYIRIFILLLKYNIKSKMEFNTDFIISAAGILSINLSAVASIFLMFRTTNSIGGFTYTEILFIYSVYLLVITPQQILCDNVWNIWMYFLDGSFIRYLLRPLDSMFYFLTEKTDLKGFFQFIFGLLLFIYSASRINYSWSILSGIWFIVILLSSSVILICLMVVAAALGFWILDPFEVISLVNKVKEFGRYPITIYNVAFQLIFTVIFPIGFLAFYPAQGIIGKGELVATLTVFVAIILSFIARYIWNKGLKYYKPTGS